MSRTNLDLKSRIFSLRLIMQILQTSGPIFRSSEDFLYVIKTYLCVSLSRNGVSSIPELFEMALFNFVELLDKFKAHLKIQIEVCFLFSFSLDYILEDERLFVSVVIECRNSSSNASVDLFGSIY